jgi:hypothetical protein
MPSFAHEGLIELFRNRPELAPELLRDALHIVRKHSGGLRCGLSSTCPKTGMRYTRT